MTVVNVFQNDILLPHWGGWKLVKLSAIPVVVVIPRNKKIILPFILLVLAVLFD